MTAKETAPLDSSGRHYAALDGLRGIAVLLVFCVHAAGNSAFVVLGANFAQSHFVLLTAAFDRVLYWLYASHHGVFLFFVLSGLLIGRMWWPRPVMRYRTFAWRRTLRIYPAFLLAFAGSLVFACASGTWQPPDVPRLVANLLFLNGAPGTAVTAFNIVTWSLFYEMTFYLVFPLVAWAALASGARAAPWVAIAAIALPMLAMQLGANPLVLCWSLLLIGVAFAMAEARIRALAARLPAAVVMLAFYLVHWMLVVLVARVVSTHVQALGGIAATLAIFAGGLLASAAVAAALWWSAERPYFAWVRRSRQ